MVDQAATMEEASDVVDGELNEKKASQGNKDFKKKGPRGSNVNKKSEGVPELLRGVGFYITSNCPDLYLKAVKRLVLYVCATYKNGSEVQMCLESDELILPEEIIMPDNTMNHQCKMWHLWAVAVVKNEESLKQKLQSLQAVIMSLFALLWKKR